MWTFPLALVRIPARAPVDSEQEDRGYHPYEGHEQREELEQQHGSIVRAESFKPVPRDATG